VSKLTQRELASQLGLSYATVSRVFNGDTRVQECTRKRVLSEAERLGFRGSPLARALRLKRSFAIGVVVANSTDSYWLDVMAAMERRAREDGYHVIICHRDQDSASSKELRFLLDRQVDALVVAPNPRHECVAGLAEVEETGVPLLLLNSRVPGHGGHYLGTDSFNGSRRLCEYLLSLGHRRIGVIAGPQGDYTADARVAGYRRALEVNGVRECADLVTRAGWGREHGESGARELLSRPERPTAIMASNDSVAIGAYLELRRQGVRVPEDISLAGYSGDRVTELLATPLTTVAQPVEELGRRAAEIVLGLIEGHHDELVSEELQDELLVRASCAPPTAPEAPGCESRTGPTSPYAIRNTQYES
jgi:LacI family transcriptional regulator